MKDTIEKMATIFNEKPSSVLHRLLIQAMMITYTSAMHV